MDCELGELEQVHSGGEVQDELVEQPHGNISGVQRSWLLDDLIYPDSQLVP
jgi:hypothetical protein